VPDELPAFCSIRRETWFGRIEWCILRRFRFHIHFRTRFHRLPCHRLRGNCPRKWIERDEPNLLPMRERRFCKIAIFVDGAFSWLRMVSAWSLVCCVWTWKLRSVCCCCWWLFPRWSFGRKVRMSMIWMRIWIYMLSMVLGMAVFHELRAIEEGQGSIE